MRIGQFAFCIATAVGLNVVVACPTLGADKEYSLPTLSQAGVAIDGPSKVTVRCVNPFRFANAKLTTETTTDQPTDVSTAFSGLAAAANAVNSGGSNGGSGGQSVPKAARTNDAFVNSLNTIEDAARASYAAAANEVAIRRQKIARAASAITNTVLGSQSYFGADCSGAADATRRDATKLLSMLRADNGEQQVLVHDPGDTQDPKSKTLFDSARLDWPAAEISNAHTQIATARAYFTGLGATGKDRAAEMDGLLKELSAFEDPTAQQAYVSVENAVRNFIPTLTSVEAAKDPTAVSTDTIACENWTAAQHTTVTFTAEDRLDPSQTKAVSQSVVTVNCYSRLALTTGGGYVKLPSDEFAVGSAPGATAGTTVTTVQRSANRSDSTLAIPAIAHFAITSPQQPVALHLSLAAPVTGSGMLGLSVSVKRAIWFTAGLYRMETTQLTNGFTVGQTVPSGTTLTTTKVPMYRIGGAISFPIVPQAGGGKQQTPDTSKDNPPKAKPPGPGTTPPAATPKKP